MIKELSICILPEEENNQGRILSLIMKELSKSGIRADKKDITTVFVKKSIDARHSKIKLYLRYQVYIGEKPEDQLNSLPEWKKADGSKSVIIIGSGPAGLFGALTLLEHGIKPVIIERGNSTSERKRDIASISTKNIVDEDSNYCFGEGGAGTFSDGKLYTRSNKRGNIPLILKIFAHFGADNKIITDAHPHIGTDKLPSIINNMRDFIIQMGGEFYFNTKAVEIITDNSPSKKFTGIKTLNVNSGEEKIFKGHACLLATGHSAADIYEMMAKADPSSLEAKTFAAGVRVEHPRELIDAIQFHGRKPDNLGAAEYSLVCQQEDRGVYSFCMCPGGFVVPSASGKNQIVVNGMSAAKRNSRWSNAAIVVEIRPEDIPEEFKKEAENKGCPALAGLLWRSWLEELTYKNAEGQKAPAQLMTDFMEGTLSSQLPPSSYAPGLVSSRLDQWLPVHIAKRLKAAFPVFNKKMKGYLCDSALLIASETRTSTPVRILRDKESCQSVSIENLYPAGEGSGYAGGIVSSAMDGVKCCSQIATKLCK
ncbi:NAD(P)/FAD-dependent oxidoreductase [Treponema sp.]|uniref:NAD(P)/FAD-dependent oxidoreductase n=1 Tax=Treponema sp. TaxID=166 RepID=UPI0025F6A8F8|nr:FAD-binding protein [Treponema sp.]MCR5218053.1 FAD-binding protein [Treponema sp.]